MLDLSRLNLVVLAGGEGSRLGGPKSRLKLSGRPILEDLLDRLAWPGPAVLVAHRLDPSPAGVERFARVLFDCEPGQGPLAGVATAVAAVGPAMIVPVDLHRLRREHLQPLAAAGLGIAMYRIGGQIEPLPIFASDPAAIEAHYRSGARSLRSLQSLGGAGTIDAPFPADVFEGINTPEQLAAAGGGW